MEDFQRELQEKVKSYAEPHRQAKQVQQWTLMFVGSHGKSIIIKRFKGLAVLFVLLLFSALAAAVGSYVLYDLQVRKTKGQNQEIEASKKQIATLKHENEMLLARAVMAESGQKPEQPKKDGKKAPEPEKPIEKSVEKPPEPAPEAAKPETKPAPSDAVKEEPLKLSVENFEAAYHRARRTLTLKFYVKNEASPEQKFSGYAMMVLKTANGRKSQSVPHNIELASGKPVPKPQGESFEVNRSKQLELEVKGERSPDRFETATVFVTDKSGKILIEKEFPVKITY